MSDIHFVAFRGTMAHKVIEHLLRCPTHVIDSKVSSIKDIVEDMYYRNASHIIGLGEYSGVDQDKLRYETSCNKRFRNTDLADVSTLKNDEFLETGKLSKYTNGIGNSWCNLLSIKMLNTPRKNYKYAFIHIPKNFDVQTAANEILTSLPNNVAVK